MSSGKAWSGAGCGVPSISMGSPPWSFCLGLAGWPLTRTWPASMRSWTRARLMSGMAWARYWSRRRLAAAGSAVKVRMSVFGVVFEFRGRGWAGGVRFFDTAGGAVLGLDGAAALALGEHVLRRHG